MCSERGEAYERNQRGPDHRLPQHFNSPDLALISVAFRELLRTANENPALHREIIFRDDIRAARATSVRLSRLRPLGECYALSLVARLYRESVLQHSDERLVLSGSECSADPDPCKLGIFDEDLARVVAIHLGNRIGECGLVKPEIALAPAQKLVYQRRQRLAHDHGRTIRARDTTRCDEYR